MATEYASGRVTLVVTSGATSAPLPDAPSARHGSAYAAVVAPLVDEYVTAGSNLEIVAPGVFDPECGTPVRGFGKRTYVYVLCAQFAVEGVNVVAAYLHSKDAGVSGRNVERRRAGLALRILPDFKTAATLEVDSDASVTLLRLAAGIGQHPFSYCVVFENTDVGDEVVDVPLPAFVEIFATYADLLDSADVEICHK